MKKIIFSAAILSAAWAAAQNTGIGTTNPTEKLEVIGNAKVRGSGYFTDGDKFNVSITPLFNDYSVIQAYEGPGVFNNLQIDGKKLILNNKNGGYTTIGGKTQIGYDSSILPTEVLNVNGNIKAESLAGTGDRMVLANENGVLKTQSTADAVAANSEWVYDAATERINLKRSGQTTGFTNKVFYDNTNGAYFNVSQESTRWFNRATNTYLTGLSTLKGVYHHTFVTSDKIIPGDGDGAKIVTKSSLLVNETSGNEIKFAIGSQSGVTIDEASTSPVDVVYGSQNSIAKNNTGTNRKIMGGNNSVVINDGNVSQFAIGQASSISVHTPQNVTGAVIGGYSGIGITPRAGFVNSMHGFLSEFIFDQNNKIGNAAAITANITAQNEGIPSIDNLYGFTMANYIGDMSKVNSFYGIYLNDVKGAANNNFSIYTNAGKLRFGDLTGTGDRLVVADADGVLKTGTQNIAQATSKWEYDANNQSIRLTKYSDGITARSFANSVNITDNAVLSLGSWLPDSSPSYPQVGAGIIFNESSNTDFISLYRFEKSFNNTELRLTLGDDWQDNARDAFVIGKNSISNLGNMNNLNASNFVPMFYFSSIGNLGFNVPDPTARLDIKGSGTDATTKALKISDNTGKENITVLDNGNLGIATTTPTEKLEVAGNIKVSGTGATITDGGACTNPGTISYSVDSFYGCTPTGWKKLHN